MRQPIPSSTTGTCTLFDALLMFGCKLSLLTSELQAFGQQMLCGFADSMGGQLHDSARISDTHMSGQQPLLADDSLLQSPYSVTVGTSSLCRTFDNLQHLPTLPCAAITSSCNAICCQA